jgi:cytosine/adenosine deaminase-related metal-dependent hydrolase
MDQKKLTALFEKLGARNPEGWARRQFEQGVPQLARFLFLRQAWRAVVPEGDSGWIAGAIASAEARPDDAYASVGHALRSLRSHGATNEELTDLVRGMQAELLFQICYLLEDPGDLEPDVEDMTWSLVETDEEGNVIDDITGLHESVLEMDPTGREMRPRPR